MLIDALHCGSFDRETFQLLRDSGVTCVTVTCGFWENAMESFEAIGEWRELVRAQRGSRLHRPQSGRHRPRRGG